jgi:uncharacterized protein
MSNVCDSFDLNSLRLAAGEARLLELSVRVEPLVLSDERYLVAPAAVQAQIQVARTSQRGYWLGLRFQATLTGPCMRCLAAASRSFAIDTRELSQPDGGEGVDSPYVQAGLLDASAWVRDALMLALPPAILCADDCAGLCAVCGADLNHLPGHVHERAGIDPRWARLAELDLGGEPDQRVPGPSAPDGLR